MRLHMEQPMKLMRMAKLEDFAQRAVNGDCVNASSDRFPVPSAVAEEECIAPVTRGVPSTSAAVVPSEVVGPSAHLPPAVTSGNESFSTHMWMHFPTREEIEAESRHCETVQAKLGAMPSTQRKFKAMLPDSTPASATSEGAKFCLVQVDVLSNLLCCTVCMHCLGTGLTVQEGTKLGLAGKLEDVCSHCAGIPSLKCNLEQFSEHQNMHSGAVWSTKICILEEFGAPKYVFWSSLEH